MTKTEDDGKHFDLITGLPVESWAEDMAARRKARKMKLQFDSDWLRKRAEADGDLPSEAGAPEEMLPIETEDVVALIAQLRSFETFASQQQMLAIRHAADELQSLSDRIAVLEDAVRVSAQAFRLLEEVAVAQLEHDKARNFIKPGEKCRSSLTKEAGIHGEGRE